ncbi:hypothetical protein T11_17255 [Trichinella zimbabwensis]|uniref:Uncharacterized protein n=1 Tax=Trichinella zimbabwensis TaxID=268475 RepID=A0A0V1GBZ7_9BILA|nr:hypothetical protein T11_17255 [Trichinella zimbabwensis]
MFQVPKLAVSSSRPFIPQLLGSLGANSPKH